jgi:phosphatidate cytidylyltransferase
VTRVLSGAVLALLAGVLVWFAPPFVFWLVGEGVLILAFAEYTALARRSGFSVPSVAAGVAAVLASSSFARLAFRGQFLVPLDVVLMAALVALGALSLPRWRGGADALGHAAAAFFPLLYLALPVGAMLAIRETNGRLALLLLVLTIVASDTAQYYTGRLVGRRPLAPSISPNKTVEGALGGFVAGASVMALAGDAWLPAVPVFLRAALGAAVVALGIAGDLFESMLKRSAGAKDSSALIPGHGGVLDRLDALLFAAPVYYIALRYV